MIFFRTWFVSSYTKCLLLDEKYQRFLNNVQEKFPADYPEVDIVLQRASCLESAGDDLLKRQEAGIARMEALRNEYSEFVNVRFSILAILSRTKNVD